MSISYTDQYTEIKIAYLLNCHWQNNSTETQTQYAQLSHKVQEPVLYNCTKNHK